MLGVKAHYDGLFIDPCLPSSWPQCRVEQEFRGARYIIDILNPHALSQGHIVLEVDGVSIQGKKLPVFADGKTHHVTARILPPSPQPH
jgi:cellobiose phosphorylase